MKNENKMNEKKVICFFISICILISLLYCVFLKKSIYHVDSVQATTYSFINLVFGVEQVELIEDEYIHIRGYAFLPNGEITYNRNKVVLYNESEDVYYELPTLMEKRTDLDETYAEIYPDASYVNSGFNAIIADEELELEKGLGYKIGIKYETNGIIGVYVLDKKLGDFIDQNQL